MQNWYYDVGPQSDVVFSSRVRFARNLKNIPFPHMMNQEQSNRVVERVKGAIIESSEWAKTNFQFLDIQRLSALDKYSLMEKHLISPNLIDSSVSSGLLLSNDEKISIMINEEDHLRIQCLSPGMQLEDTYRLCAKIERLLEEQIEFSFSEKLGYLTCCPTNVGTGLRASIMLHLPALTMTGYINGILQACSKIGVAVRGIYGENTEATGGMFQVSNQVTLGVAEEEIVVNITEIVEKIIEQERALRQEIYSKEKYRLEDRIFRSLGILRGARIISTEESMKLLSDVRLGVEMGIIENIKLESLNKIILNIQPASLQQQFNQQLGPVERDIGRAEIIRKSLESNN